MFGKGLTSLALSVDIKQFLKVYKEAGETTLIDLNVAGQKDKVLIKDLQVNPITGSPVHASFHKVNLKEKITAQIPVEITGQDKNEMVKIGQGLILELLHEITVEALPTDLPNAFTVDVSALNEVGKGITVGELHYDKNKVEIVGNDPEDLVVKMDYAEMKEEVEEAVAPTEEELITKVEATQELSPEEKAEKEAKDKAAKEAREKDKEKK